MDQELDNWLKECIGKGTFENREDALEFCVGAVRAYCIINNITQGVISSDGIKEHPSLDGDTIPLNWGKWKGFFESAINDYDKTMAHFRLF